MCSRGTTAAQYQTASPQPPTRSTSSAPGHESSRRGKLPTGNQEQSVALTRAGCHTGSAEPTLATLTAVG
jgi:hypothetical protein